jgi:hypothetical protein
VTILGAQFVAQDFALLCVFGVDAEFGDAGVECALSAGTYLWRSFGVGYG